MIPNSLPSEQAAVVGQIPPQLATPATYLSDAVDMANFESILAKVFVGAMVATSTVNAKLVQAVTSGGSYKDVTGKAITALLAAGGDNRQALINCRGEELDLAGGYRFVKLSITVGTANTLLTGGVFGFHPRYAPASDNDLAAVVEIVT